MNQDKPDALVQRITSAPSDLIAQNADIFKIIEATGGFVPNGFYAVGWKPKILKAMTGLAMAVLAEDDLIGKELKWLVGNMASRASGCKYCWAHTAHNAEVIGGASPEKLDKIWEYRTNPLFSDKERAAMNFATAAAAVPNDVTTEIFDELQMHFCDEEIVEIMSVISLYGWYNRWNDSMATVLEDGPLQYAHKNLKKGGWEEGQTTGNAR